MTSREQRIKDIAYHMWDREGRPEGEGHAHRIWLAAEAQFETERAGVEDAGIEHGDEPALEKPVRPAKKTDKPEKPPRSAKAKATGPDLGKGEKAGKRQSKAK